VIVYGTGLRAWRIATRNSTLAAIMLKSAECADL